MQRPSWFGHYVKKNHANQRPQDFVFVDVETSQEQVPSGKGYQRHSLKLGVACYVRWDKGQQPVETWFDFEHATHFWEWLKKRQRKRRVLWVVAHNAQFDLTILGLWEKMANGEYSTTAAGKLYRDSRTGIERMSEDWHGTVAIDSTPFHVETTAAGCRVNFTDLQNYYSCSLSKIGHSVGIAKGSWDDVRNSDTDLRFYCHNDVEILKRGYLGLVKQWEQEQNGNWQLSAGGLAYSHFRHCYLDNDIAVHSHAGALDLEWASLYGGEVRCWYRGDVSGGLVHYDVNSLYPAMMQDQIYPTSLVDYIIKPNKALFTSLMSRYAMVADVNIQTAIDHYPLRSADRILYPIGKFRTTLAGPELQEALDSGDITHCYSCAIYTYAPIFKQYTLDWWERKRAAKAKGDVAAEKFAKLMLNSLPAKFAQRTPQWVDEPRVDVVAPWKVFPWRDPDTDVIYPARSIGWQGQVCKHRVATEHSFPLVFAYVTSYARVFMRQMRRHIAPLGLFYQDTDSLIISKDVADSTPTLAEHVNESLGGLHIEGEYDNATFRGPKNYTVNGNHVISGIRSRDTQVAPMVWNGTRFERSNHLFMRQPDSTLREYQINIDTPGTDTEGGLRPDGFTFPRVLPDGLPPDVLQRIISDRWDRKN